MKNFTKINCITLFILGAILTIVSIKAKLDITTFFGIVACIMAVLVLIGESKKDSDYYLKNRR